MNRDFIKTEGYQDLIVKTAIENQIDSKYTSFLAINERNDKVYDVPQIEETPVEHSFDFDRIVVQRCEYPVLSDEVVSRSKPVVDRFEPVADRFEHKIPMSFKKTKRTLKVNLNELIEIMKSNDIIGTLSLILEINIKIRAIDSNKTISSEIKTLINKIKSMNEWAYNQLFNGVQETIKRLFS